MDTMVMKQAIKDTVDTQGWNYISEWIDSQIDSAVMKLTASVKPDETLKIASYQEKIKTLKCLKGFIESNTI